LAPGFSLTPSNTNTVKEQHVLVRGSCVDVKKTTTKKKKHCRLNKRAKVRSKCYIRFN